MLDAVTRGREAVIFLWVAKRARGVSLGRCMSNAICCNTVSYPLEESVEFWRKVGFQVPSTEKNKPQRKLSNMTLEMKMKQKIKTKKTTPVTPVTNSHTASCDFCNKKHDWRKEEHMMY